MQFLKTDIDSKIKERTSGDTAGEAYGAEK